jgi:hypothetical protein
MPANIPAKLPTPFTFSQSSLQDYMDCARRFQLRYIEQLHWPAVETEPILENERRQQEGQLFHRLAQQAIIGLPAEKLERLASGEALSRWWQNFTPQLEKLRAHSAAMPEITLSAPVGAHRLLAKFDLITKETSEQVTSNEETPSTPQPENGSTGQRSNVLTIFDWKTYHKRPRNDRMSARMQTRVYRYLLAVAGAHLNGGQTPTPEQIEMVYWYSEFPTEPAIFRYDRAQFERDKAHLEKLVSEIAVSTDMPMTDEAEKCKFCPYRSYCDRGVRAGDGDEAESEAIIEINLEQIAEIEF